MRPNNLYQSSSFIFILQRVFEQYMHTLEFSDWLLNTIDYMHTLPVFSEPVVKYKQANQCAQEDAVVIILSVVKSGRTCKTCS